MSHSDDLSSDALVVLVTVPGMEEGERIARKVIEARSCACVNLVPGLRSVYRWEGRVEVDDEVLMILKTRVSKFETLRRMIIMLHPYDQPEVLALPVDRGDSGYLAWLERETNPPRPESTS